MERLSAGGDLLALRVLSMEALKFLKSTRDGSYPCNREPSQLVSPEHLGRTIDLSA